MSQTEGTAGQGVGAPPNLGVPEPVKTPVGELNPDIGPLGRKLVGLVADALSFDEAAVVPVRLYASGDQSLPTSTPAASRSARTRRPS